jgi:hypothetical protein
MPFQPDVRGGDAIAQSFIIHGSLIVLRLDAKKAALIRNSAPDAALPRVRE